MFRNIVFYMIVGLTVMFLSGCTAMAKASLGKGKEYKFTDEEGGVQTYYCKEENKLHKSMQWRAKEAFGYFNKKNEENTEKLVEAMMGDKEERLSTFELAMQLNKDTEALALEVLEKYDCALIDYEE